MIFAIDASRQVRWFYPAYQRADSDPESISIKGGKAAITLPDVIRHDFAVGPLTMYAVFTHAPLRVLDLEAMVRKSPAELTPSLPLGTAQQVLSLWVDP